MLKLLLSNLKAQMWHTIVQTNRTKEQNLLKLVRVSPSSYLQLLQATEGKKLCHVILHVIITKRKQMGRSLRNQKIQEIITRHTTSRYNSCCNAGSCSNTSFGSNSLVHSTVSLMEKKKNQLKN